MIAIGVGIDYSLLIVTRYRNALHDGHHPQHAVVTAVGTAGRSVLFAGATVMISLLGMVVMRLPYLHGVAFGSALAVGIMMALAVTLLPAVLGFVGTTIDRLHVPFLGRTRDPRRTLSFRWSRVVQRRPWPAAIASLAVLLALAAPVLGLRLGFPDAGNGPDSLTSRRAYDLLTDGFGPGFNGHLLVTADLSAGGSTADLDTLRARLQATDGVVAVSPAVLNPAGDTAVIAVTPASAPQADQTEALLHTVRDDVIPAVIDGTGATVYVGGLTAAFLDQTEVIAQRLPLFIAAVVGLSFLLLLVVFRSLLVAVKAARDEPAQRPGRLRRHHPRRRRRLVRTAHRHPRRHPGAQLHPDDDVRHPVRPQHGLRGVPPVPHPGGIPAQRQQRRRRRRRPRRHRPHHHRRRRHHDRRLPGLRARRPGLLEADRRRHGHRHLRRRHPRADGARPRLDGAARRPQLVAAPLARPAPTPRPRRRPDHPHRGPDRPANPGGGAGRRTAARRLTPSTLTNHRSCRPTRHDLTEGEAMQHSLNGWDIGRFDNIDWIPWDTGDKARAKVLGIADGFHVALIEAGAGYRGGPHEHDFPEFLYVVDGALRTQGQEMTAGDAYAASPGSTHTDFAVDTGATYLLIFKL